MNKEDVDYREIPQHQTPAQRSISHLEARWNQRLPKWERATLRLQVWLRRCVRRARAKRAAFLESRRLHSLAEEALKAGRFQDAIQLVNESIEKNDSTYWAAYCVRGWLRFNGGDVSGALEDLAVCVRETPCDVVPLKTRARIYVSQGRWEEASRDLSAGLRINPHDLEAYILRGNAMIHMENYDGAVYDFGMVIDRTEVPSAADYTRRACAYCCRQNWQKAIDDLNKSIVVRETIQALTLRGRVRACMRRWKSAVADYDAALGMDPDTSCYLAAVEGKTETEAPYLPLPMLNDEDAAKIIATTSTGK